MQIFVNSVERLNSPVYSAPPSIYCVPAQETAKHRAKFGWLPSSDVAASNKANTRKPLKFAGVPQTGKPISAASGPKFTILWGHVEKILLFNKFFSDCQYMPSLRRYSPTKLRNGAQMGIFGDFLRPVFLASRLQHVSDLHRKFTLWPHHVWKYGRHPICDGWD